MMSSKIDGKAAVRLLDSWLEILLRLIYLATWYAWMNYNHLTS